MTEQGKQDDCNSEQRRMAIVRYFFNDLRGKLKRQEMQTHLEQCERCRDKYASLAYAWADRIPD